MRFFDLLRRHLLDHFFLTDRSVRVAANGAEHVPHIGAHKVGRGHAKAKLIVPSNTRLRARMPFHGTAQIPFEGSDMILLNAQTKSVHDTDKLLGVGIARTRRWPESFHRFFKAAGLHQVACFFDFGPRGCRDQAKYCRKFAHGGLLAVGLALPAAAELPRPLTDNDFIAFDAQKAKIGQLLFYDKILSGNRNISCGTCHNPDLGGTDGLSLGIGEGGVGLGRERTPGTGEDQVVKRIPRNAPALWNLGAKDLTVMFHDGRLSVSDLFGNGFNSPAEEWLPEGLNSLLAAQAMFPVTSAAEMAGQPEENEISGAVNDRIDAGWPIIAKRVRAIPEYGDMFVAAFDHIDAPEDVTMVEVANAIASFIGTEWKSFDSPFDAYLAGDTTALDPAAKRGMDVFFGEGNCAACHSGPLFTDQSFHALALPAFGPGRTRRFDPIPRDVGRIGESDILEDAYRFRTPMLRNIALTAPYGHNGAYPTLESMVKHHLDPVAANASWTRDMAQLPDIPWLTKVDFIIQSDRREMERLRAKVDITPVALSDAEVDDLVAFLNALTGKTAEALPMGRPESVPSGLSVD